MRPRLACADVGNDQLRDGHRPYPNFVVAVGLEREQLRTIGSPHGRLDVGGETLLGEQSVRGWQWDNLKRI